MTESGEILCDDLDKAIEHYQSMGYRLDMIFPADSPRKALMWKDGDRIWLTRSDGTGGLAFGIAFGIIREAEQPLSDWVKGRAGMEYRDLIPGRMGGKVIASHIRLTEGGEVADYVHYHKVLFQMIYCIRGRIKVVYEDQGQPFWLESGDCVLQPPEIRHRVLESTAGAEVIEVSMPAEHETWVEHDIELPTGKLRPDRSFSGQRFVHSKASEAKWHALDKYMEVRETGILLVSDRLADVRVFRRRTEVGLREEAETMMLRPYGFTYRLGNGETLVVDIGGY